MRISTISTIFSMIVILLSFHGVNAQDLEAKKVLDDVYKHYHEALGVFVEFDLVMDLSESEREVQKGIMIQKGEKYKVQLESYSVYNNGDKMWMYLADANECQLTSVLSDDEESEVPNLNDILSMYKSGEFDYRILDDGSVRGAVKKIEFKPTDLDADYFKMILLVDTDQDAPKSIKFFHRDGSRYAIEISKIDFNQEYPDDTFEFKEIDFPGVHVEDLR